MIRKVHKTLTGETGAEFSDCLCYRYRLWRTWGDGPALNFVMLNPSTADELTNDPTVERCQRRANNLGFDGLVVTNLFAWRATDPRELKPLSLAAVQEIETVQNDDAIRLSAAAAGMVICAWGNDGHLFNRSRAVLGMLRTECPQKLHALKLAGTGEPCHPLYLSYDLKPILF